MTYTNPMLPPRRRPADTSVFIGGTVSPGEARAIRVRQKRRVAKMQMLRREAEQQIERLLELLDANDFDCDLELDTDAEDGADAEPSLGFLECDDAVGHVGHEAGTHDDREAECEDEGAQCDDEGDAGDSGIGDTDGLMEQIQHCGGFGDNGFARCVV